MPRKTRLRKIVEPPKFKSFRPTGVQNEGNESIEFLYEEYEAIKLADYDSMNHLEAGKLMGVSRPTFARIYESARRKIARALVETKEIKAMYGNAYFDKNWYLCTPCHARFTVPRTFKSTHCPVCSSGEVESIATGEEKN